MTSELRLSPLPEPATANPNPNPDGGKHRTPTFLSTSSPLSSARHRILCSQTKKRFFEVRGPRRRLRRAIGRMEPPQAFSKDSRIRVDIYDEVGVGGGASGVSGGLLHPYSPKAKVLWRGGECWKECLDLLAVAERAVGVRVSNSTLSDSAFNFDEPIVLRRGILRPATTEKNVEILKENAQNCLQNCSNLCVPFDSAIYMPQAMNIHPMRYLQALFLACLNLAEGTAASDSTGREMKFY